MPAAARKLLFPDPRPNHAVALTAVSPSLAATVQALELTLDAEVSEIAAQPITDSVTPPPPRSG